MRRNRSSKPSFQSPAGVDKALPPVGQRAGVVRPHVEEIAHHEISVARHQLVHRGDARQEAAGENVALDKIDAFAVVAVALVLNGDGLNRHPSTGRSRA